MRRGLIIGATSVAGSPCCGDGHQLLPHIPGRRLKSYFEELKGQIDLEFVHFLIQFLPKETNIVVDTGHGQETAEDGYSREGTGQEGGHVDLHGSDRLGEKDSSLFKAVFEAT